MGRFRTWFIVGVLVTGGGLLWPNLAGAQGLADVARAEEVRRQIAPKAAKTYTNQDLRPDHRTRQAPPAPAPPGEVSPTSESASTPEAAPKPTESGAGADASAKKDEKYWRTRITEARERLDRTKLFAEALQSRINAVTADFVNRDNPVQRAGIAQERVKALEELQRVQNEIRDFTKAIADIEEEARKAGVPPGWLR